MKNENTKALKETLQAYKQNPTYGHEMQLSMLISIATSLAVIADKMSDNDMTERHGEWIRETLSLPLSDSVKECVRCSKCNLHFDNESNFCPNCGAKMEVSEDGKSV